MPHAILYLMLALGAGEFTVGVLYWFDHKPWMAVCFLCYGIALGALYMEGAL
jgi:hypothetical protein